MAKPQDDVLGPGVMSEIREKERSKIVACWSVHRACSAWMTIRWHPRFYTPDRMARLSGLGSLPALNWGHCGMDMEMCSPRFVGKHKCQSGCKVFSRVPGM